MNFDIHFILFVLAFYRFCITSQGLLSDIIILYQKLSKVWVKNEFWYKNINRLQFLHRISSTTYM